MSSPTPTPASTRLSFRQYQPTIGNTESSTADQRQATADQLADLLRRLRASLAESNRQQLIGPRLSPTQSTLLRLVRTRPGITFAEARRALRLTERALRVHITRLILAGLLEREQDSRSPSTLRLYPTALTHTRSATSFEHHRDQLHDALAALSIADQQAITAVLPALRTLANQVEANQSAPTREPRPPLRSGPHTPLPSPPPEGRPKPPGIVPE